MAMRDGLGGDTFTNVLIDGGSLTGHTLLSGGDIFANGSIEAQSRGVMIANIGSAASSQNMYLQAGSDVTAAGSTVWVVLPEGFTDSTYFISYGVRGTADRTISTIAGSTNAGSFFVFSHGGGSVDFDWTAVGVK